MPTEIRKIVFSNQELQEAIVLFNPRCNDRLPDGDIKSCTVKSDDSIKVLLRVQPLRSEGEKTIVLTDAFLGAALYNYCMSKKIPIPRRAKKSLQVIGDNIALQINIGVSEKRVYEVVDEDP